MMTSVSRPARPGVAGRTVLLGVAAVVLAAHGLVHLMGVALLWRLGEPGTLRYTDVSPAAGSTVALVVGGLWLIAAALFVGAAMMLLRHRRWAAVGGIAALLSIAVLAPSARLAIAGLVVDVVVLITVAVLVRRPSPR